MLFRSEEEEEEEEEEGAEDKYVGTDGRQGPQTQDMCRDGWPGVSLETSSPLMILNREVVDASRIPTNPSRNDQQGSW